MTQDLTKNLANDNLTKQDYVLPFMLQDSCIKGKVITLSNTVTEIVAQHNYPEPIANLLAELLLFTAMLGHNIKTKGTLTAEIRVEQGAIKFLVADFTSPGNLRACCDFDHNLVTSEPKFEDLINKGFLLITMDLGKDYDRYQGIIEIKGNSITSSMEEYFQSSEQLDAKFKIAVNKITKDGKNFWGASGMMIQKIANNSNDNYEESRPHNWEQAVMYMDTVTQQEMSLIEIGPKELIHRLYHEQNILIFDESPLKHACRCSEAIMHQIVNNLNLIEKERLKKDGKIEITCQFCNTTRYFD